MAKYSNHVVSGVFEEYGEQEALSSSNSMHNLDTNCWEMALKKTRRFVFLYFTQTVHLKPIKSKPSEFLLNRSAMMYMPCLFVLVVL